MKTNRLWIHDVEIVLPEGVAKGHVCVENDIINTIELKSPFKGDEDAQIINGEGMLLLPGMIDVHSDAIEKEVEPRPNTLIPLDFALYELEKKLAVAGVTTMYHSLSVGTGLSLRGDQLMQEMVKIINDYKKGRTMIRHRIHLRYEVTHFAGLAIAEELVRKELVDYFSYMNHAPGQGQYNRPGSFEAYVMKRQGVDKEEVKHIVDELMVKQAKIDWQKITELTQLVMSKGLRIASHDDDSTEQINVSKRIGASISEFPLNIETARYARQHNMDVCVGAPNIIRGGSHEHNLSAIEAIKDGAANIICSDYSPSIMLPAVFKVVEEGVALAEAVKMVSLYPAKALGIDSQYGSIQEGKKADLLLVEQIDRYPSIRQTIVNGIAVYSSTLQYGI